MKVLMISSDRNVFKEGSAVCERMKKYARMFTSLSIIIFSDKKSNFTTTQMGDNITVYPTNSRNRWMYVWDAWRIARKLGKHDVISPQDPFEAGLVASMVYRKLGARLNVQIHTDFASPYFTSNWLNKLRRIIASYVLRKADSIRVVSERIKKSVEYLKIPVTVLPIFANTQSVMGGSMESVSFPQFTRVLLTVSRLEPEKNIPNLLRAFKILIEHDTRVGLVIVGGGREEKNLRNLARGLGISENVVFAGEQSSVAPYYLSANLYIQTSLYEGFGLTLYEAALHSLPIVTTDVGLIGSVILPEHVQIVVPNDPANIANGCLKTLNNPSNTTKIASEVKRDVLQFSTTEEEYLRRYYKSLS